MSEYRSKFKDILLVPGIDFYKYGRIWIYCFESPISMEKSNGDYRPHTNLGMTNLYLDYTTQ
jgi:hypothetical protein